MQSVGSVSTALIPYTLPVTGVGFINSEVERILCDNYVMPSSNQIIRNDMNANGRQIVTYKDGSRWVVISDTRKQRERFCGFLYLQNALKEAGLNSLKAADNKIAIHHGRAGKQIIYLSKYCGDDRPDLRKHPDKWAVLGNVGFTDLGLPADGHTTNLSQIGDEIFVFDTEKHSFDFSVRQKIDSFGRLHDCIRSRLEK